MSIFPGPSEKGELCNLVLLSKNGESLYCVLLSSVLLLFFPECPAFFYRGIIVFSLHFALSIFPTAQERKDIRPVGKAQAAKG